MPGVKDRIFGLTIFLAIFFFLAVSIAFAFDDAFGPAKKIESKHFIVYYDPQLELSVLSQQLNISLSDKLIVGKSINKNRDFPYDYEADFLDTLDTLFMRVCDILDMRLYSFKSNIKICKDHDQLKRIYYNFFNKSLARHAFYVYTINTIYISQDSFNCEVLGHEVSHAVVSHYFVVLPSVKIMEVLAGYTEYQLRKIEQ